MKKLVCLKFKKVLAFALSLAVTLGCFAGMGFTASASIASTWGMLELESKDKVWISTGLGNEAYLKFIPKCTGTYVLESSSIGDAFVTLYDVTENAIATNDNGKDEENFRLAARLTGGATYYYGIKFTDPRYTGTCLLDHYFTDLECEHENGVYSAGQSATCHSDGYAPGYWCDDCDCWYMGHDRIDGGHLDTKEDTDDLCDRCGGEMPGITGEIGPTARPYTVKFQFYSDGSMDIFGTEHIRSTAFERHFAYFKNALKSVKIYGGVKYIDDMVFSEMKALETVTLPDSITSIRREVFMSCESLKSINIPNKVEYIAEYAFSGCKALESIKLPDSMAGHNNGLGWGVFYGCTSLKSVDLGNGMESVEMESFKNCISLEKVTQGGMVRVINTSAFEGCTSLKEFNFSKELTTIGEAAFKGCVALKDPILKGEIENIKKSAFEGCSSISTVFFASELETVGEKAFYGCNSLSDVYFGGKDKSSVQIASGNNSLQYAQWHLDHCIGKTAHVYDNACDAECNDCGSLRKADDHKYSYECDTTCDVCGAERSAGNHRYNTICDTVCKNCGETTRVVLVHYYGGDCDVDCDVCGKTRVAAPHSYDNDCDRYCNGCNKRREPKHTYTNSCDTSCNVCGMGRGTEHKYTYECDKTCNICGESRDAYHNYTSECDYECNYCGLKRMVKHNYSVFTTKATFSKDGSTGESCTVCGMGISTDIKAVKSVKLSATEYTYNGKAQKPSVTVKDSAGKKLKNGTDYTVSYSKGCKKVGSYKVTVTLKGKYSGSKTLTFKINPKATKISKVTAAKKSLKLKIAKQTTETTGYEVQYSTSKKFTKSTTKTATVKKAKTTSLTLKKLKAKKTYYLKIRTYKTVGGKKFYSAWSKVTSKKTK